MQTVKDFALGMLAAVVLIAGGLLGMDVGDE